MSGKTKQQSDLTEGERASKRTINDVLAKSGQLYEELCKAADQVIDAYKEKNRAIASARRKKGQFAPVPWPERRETSRGRSGLYWKVLRPNGSRGKFQFTSQQIRRIKGPEPYPQKVFSKVTDDLNHDLVLETERRLRAIERRMKAARDIQEIIRDASKENERG